MRRVLCVAEKPSIAKSITQILSGGQFTTNGTRNTYVKNYEFTYPQTQSYFVVTSVIGHLMESDFDDAYRNWSSCDPFQLFDAGVQTRVAKDKESIEQNLLQQARRSDMLMIWTDCDREGEHIGLEVARTCRKTKPNIEVKRARFSAIIAQQIHNAAQHPVELDRAQAEAVEARILLDLRIGAAFTRLQTLTLQQRIPQEDRSVISYGPCQFPTLGFVVQRFRQVKDFRPENFWYIYLSLHHPDMPDGEETVFSWKRVHLFDQLVAVAIYVQVLQNCVATVTKVTNKSTKKWKPLPLTTVELQKAGSRLLKMAPKAVLDVAEKLYQQGFLSYPRTETDQYDDQFDFMTLLNKHKEDPAWGGFATKLCQQEGEFNRPRKGKNNDKAHPPIHPTAHAGNLAGKEKAVYDYITRRFLASCSKDAEGWQTTVDVECGGEEFTANGLVVLERNYLEVYPYDKWNGQQLPEFVEGAQFTPTACELREGQTTKPHLLTEADLVSLMDKNGIGTDATIAQHIQTIIDRQYVIEKQEGGTKYLAPSTLGIGLVEGYDHIGLERSLSKPYLRRETERNMVQICQRTKNKADVLDQTIDQYKAMFIIARREFGTISDTVVRYINGQGDDGGAPMAVDGGNNGGGGGGGRGGGGGGGGRGGRGGGPNGGGRGGGTGGPGPGGNAGGAGDDPSDDSDFDFAKGSKRGRGGTTRARGRGATKAGTVPSRLQRT
ncbi:prokaryotic type I DNA topoisomerase [Pluteus cervinus]|uniref:Prokaryotic type I DNA topoisomerase n=1 Tax=Pluteus cervinus TaxID=181527 RepID=A0ACD3APC4_9AGAR|nr:prokaryotic type I DNA topoisomerase [Pluteus cervinus]